MILDKCWRQFKSNDNVYIGRLSCRGMYIHILHFIYLNMALNNLCICCTYKYIFLLFYKGSINVSDYDSCKRRTYN